MLLQRPCVEVKPPRSPRHSVHDPKQLAMPLQRTAVAHRLRLTPLLQACLCSDSMRVRSSLEERLITGLVQSGTFCRKPVVGAEAQAAAQSEPGRAFKATPKEGAEKSSPKTPWAQGSSLRSPSSR